MKSNTFFFVLISVFFSNLIVAQPVNIIGNIVYDCIWTNTYPIQAKGELCFNGEVSSFIAISDFTKSTDSNSENGFDNDKFSMVEKSPGHFTIIRKRDPNTMKDSKNVPFNIFMDINKGVIFQLVNETSFAYDKKLSQPFSIYPKILEKYHGKLSMIPK
ncbi:hypothetical protein [Tenuifilum thalassicum]|uniref:Uncharacterized protein n=1 Tax=Tenuifilum thalassicum TaxID=2590900 RepID=A0A7D4C0L1_9BACT|nr:hypothetical protein [Tenuifilum thalassicum]QKG80144.1 hypothetical protein FHG85_07680 [Tenuifilum thalassicum]